MKNKNIQQIIVSLAIVVSISINIAIHPVATAAEQDDLRTATAWFNLYLYLIQQTEGFTPPVAARALGYAGVTLYEAVVPGMPDHQSLVGQLNELTALPQPATDQSYLWPAVANSALAALARELFFNTARENEALIDALEQQLATKLQAEADPATLTRSADYGRTLAQAIYTWSMNDGGHRGQLKNFPLDYQPANGAGVWQPTPPKFSTVPLQPYWGDNRPFALKSNGVCEPSPPPPYSAEKNSVFYQQAVEVYNTVRQLTPEQQTIALFWADDPGRTVTPPGHSIALTTQILREQNASLTVAAEAYAKVGIAVADAFIGCWRTKYKYSVVRPITYIQQVIDPTWNHPDLTDPVTTPPFPEYTSGHSVQSGATAVVLSALFGENYVITDHTQDHRGFLPRSFDSFAALAQEAAISRLYGGIHYRAAIEAGLTQGHCIGKQVLALRFKK
jgi:membrane-associated phospholipid phosphatase